MTSTMSTWHSNQLSYAPASGGCAGLAIHGLPNAPGRTRTPNPLIRSQVLYPIELRALMPTTGLEPVRPFEHWSLKPACLPIPARGHSRRSQCSGRDSNPHGVNPHRILNPARLPIPPPELPAIPPLPSGAEGSRTPDLLNAIQALSQLSYGPGSADMNQEHSFQWTRIFKQPSGADGTRTRGLRCDRPAL